MKLILKTILKYYLKHITRLVLLIHQPTIIAIAGSTNKTFIKEEVVQTLKKQGISVRSNPRSFNTEIGLPLAILYLPSGYNSYKNWLPIIFKAPLAIFKTNFPKFLVLELGISDHGDMKYLLSIIRPKIAIITDITQRYLEGFTDMDDLVGEYKLLVKKIQKNGLVILNYDNIRVRELSKAAKAKVKFFGTQAGSNWHAIEVRRGEAGQAVKVIHDKEIKQYKINYFGMHYVYSMLVGLIIKNYFKNII